MTVFGSWAWYGHWESFRALPELFFENFILSDPALHTSRLKAWMRRFKGVASAYLESYLGWRRLIERVGDRITPRHCIAAALG